MRVLLVALSALGFLAGAANGSSDTTVYTSQYLWKNYDRCRGDVLYSTLGRYYYCYLNEGNVWDYCSPAPQGDNYARPLLNKAFTLDKGPCKDDCSWSRDDSNYMCTSYWNDRRACNPTLYSFFKSYTYYGDECFGTCDKHDGEDHYWCRTEPGGAKYCSPYKVAPQEQKPFDLMKSIPKCSPGSCGAGRKRRQVTFCSAAAQTLGSIETYITTLAALSVASSVLFYSQPNQQEGVYRYAYMQPVTAGSPILPLVISSRITNNTVRNPGEREAIPSPVRRNIVMMGSHRGRQDGNDDENGHLIASENGGPTEVYNFVPQPRSLNRGMLSGGEFARMSDWRRNEDSIHQWARSASGRRVDQTVVVVYDTVNGLVNPRPVGLAQRVVYHNSDGTVSFECQDYYSNDPSDDPELVPISP